MQSNIGQRAAECDARNNRGQHPNIAGIKSPKCFLAIMTQM